MAINKMGGDPCPFLTKQALRKAETKKVVRKNKRKIVRKNDEVKS